MKLPNADKAIVEVEKLRDYCLNPLHPSRLGLTGQHAEVLRVALVQAARTQQASLGFADEYGQRYVIDFKMNSSSGGTAAVRSSWIVRRGESVGRLTSCFVL